MSRNSFYSSLLAATFLFYASNVGAQNRPSRPRPARSRAEPAVAEAAPPALPPLSELVRQLQSTEVDRVREAIELIGTTGEQAGVRPLIDLVNQGQSDVITDSVIDALGALGGREAIEMLAELTHHRRTDARRRAYASLSRIEDARVPRFLEQGLRDSDRSIRGNCAAALGTLGSRRSVDELFRAFDRGVVEAGASIGRLGDGRALERFGGYLGTQPLSVMLAGYEQFLRRTDLNEATKIAIVQRLGEVAGPQVRRFLATYLRQFGQSDRSRLRQTVQETLLRIPAESAAPAAPSASTGGAQ